jgi:DNA-binding NtrC family response regulator
MEPVTQAEASTEGAQREEALEKPTALVVDDDRTFRDSMAELVRREGFSCSGAGSLAEARQALTSRPVDVVLVDLNLPDGSGLDLLRDPAEMAGTEVIVVTGNATVDTAISALQDGCLDYLTKPVDRPRLKSVLTNVARTRALKAELGGLRSELRQLGRFGTMVGRSAPMQRVYDLVARVAPTEATVLITGESGTGKELVAQTLHRLSRRRSGPFVVVNCGAIPQNLLESEMFGHEKGSFTGADERRVGHFERASHGTLFLDEVTEMPLDLQVKILRALESGEVQKVGAGEPTHVDVRVVVATNRVPHRAVEEGKLREDLYHRLNVFPIDLPPLRERPDDIVLLAEHFLELLNRESETSKRWTPAALERMRVLPWPGNVRGLRNAVQRAYILADGDIDADHLPAPAEEVEHRGPLLSVRVGTPLSDVERRLILATLESLEGDKRETAKLLGISLKTLYNRLAEYKGQPPADQPAQAP